MGTATSADDTLVHPQRKRLERLPVFELLVAFSLFPAVYTGADRLQPLEAVSPVTPYYLAFAAAMILGAAIVVREGSVDGRSVLVLGAAVAFVGWAALSLQWTVGTDAYAWQKLSRLAVINTTLLAFGLVLASSRRRVVAFGFVMGLVGVWLTLEAIYAVSVLETLPFATVGSETYLTHGRAIGFAVPIATYLAVSHPDRVIRTLCGLLVGLLVVGLLLVGSRGPFLAVVVALAGFAGLETAASFTRGSADRRTPVATLGLVTLVLGAVGGAFWMHGRVPWTFERLRTAGGDGESETRLFMFREALDLWRVRPVRGHGLGAFDVLTETVHTYPHNLLAEVLSELGLVGLVLVALVMVPPVMAALRARLASGDALYSALVALFVFAVVNAAFSFDLHGNRQLWFTAGLLALVWTESDGNRLDIQFSGSDR